MPARPLAVLLLLPLLLAWACAATDDINTPSRGHPAQKYTLDAVKQRAKRLRKGMPRPEVLILLGSPARQERDTWIYLPERPGLLLPADALQVRFERGAYVSHTFQPIVLGERVP